MVPARRESGRAASAGPPASDQRFIKESAMPPFVDSFGDQFGAVMINLIGTILGGLFSSLFSALSSTIFVPLFRGIATALGLPTT
jgi:hypothetical protein